MVHYLLDMGARVDQKGERGRTALYWACNRVRRGFMDWEGKGEGRRYMFVYLHTYR